MHSVKLLRLYFCISILLTGTASGQIVFSEFKNSSEYKGNWQLERAVPNFIADYLRQSLSITAYSPGTFISSLDEGEDTTSIFNDLERLTPYIKKLNATHYVTGTIEVFDISRYNFSEPTVAGYEHYSSSIKVNIKFFNFDKGTTEFSEAIEGKIDKGSLGINLLGKPTDEKTAFYRLDNLEFGGEEFSKTIVNAAMVDLCENIIKEFKYKNPASYRQLRSSAARLKEEIQSVKDKQPNIISGEIIITDDLTGDVFINLGSSDLKLNDILSVYQKDFKLIDPVTGEELGKTDKKIGEIVVVEMRSPKLSLCKILNSEIKITKGMAVKKAASKD